MGLVLTLIKHMRHRTCHVTAGCDAELFQAQHTGKGSKPAAPTLAPPEGSRQGDGGSAVAPGRQVALGDAHAAPRAVFALQQQASRQERPCWMITSLPPRLRRTAADSFAPCLPVFLSVWPDRDICLPQSARGGAH